MPHPKRLIGYLSKFKCEADFITEIFDYLGKNLSGKKPGWRLCFNHYFMSLRKQVQWDSVHSQYSGYVEMAGFIHEEATLTTELSVFLLVTLSKF